MGAWGKGAEMSPKTILVIDDDAAHRSLLVDVLEAEGFSVVAVADAADALVHLSAPVDLVLLDLVMPRAAMDGFTFLSKAGENGSPTSTPVIVLSGLGESVVEALDPTTATTLRIVSVVAKPVDLAVLLSTVRTALELPHRR